MRLLKYLFLIAVFGATQLGVAVAGPIEDANAMVAAGDDFLEKADKARKKTQKPELYQQGLQQYARAYMLITSRKLQNDVPDLLKKIDAKFDEVGKVSEVQEMREGLLQRAIDATIEGKLETAYDLLASLKELDPRDPSVDYALSVIVQRMEGG